MAKTINHPPYEIDPWKADTTEPPSDLKFNPEIVESAGKPKQAPVPPEPTEGQKKIEESISRVDRFNNEMNALREQQEKVLKEVHETIEDTDNKIKQLNELEEKIKKQVGEYTDDTDEYLRQAELLKGELKEAQGKMDKAVSDASSAISAAEKAQKALEAYKNGEKARLEEAIKEAQSGVAKAADVNKQISSLKDSLGGEIDKQIAANKAIKDIQSDNKALGSRLDDVLKTSKQGVDDAAKAVEMIANSVDVSTSAVPLIPGTTTPTWQHELVPIKKGSFSEDKDLPERIRTYYRHQPEFLDGSNNTWTSKISEDFSNVVSVDNRFEYKISFWIRATRDDTRYTYITLCDENGDRYILNKVPDTDTQKDRSANTSGNPIRAILCKPSTKWECIESVFSFKDRVEFVKIYDISFQTTSDVTKPAQVFVTDLRIAPLIPSQADVDRAQNEAIGANTKAIEANTKAVKAQDDINKQNKEFQSLQKEFNTSQTKLNKTYDAMWDAQGKRNLLQEGIDKSQNDVIRSLARPQIGNSIIDYIDLTDEEIKKGVTQPTVPTWAANMTWISPKNNESWLDTAPYPNSVYRASSKSGPVRDYARGGMAHPVNPDTEYRWSIWIKNSYNDASFYITLCDENGDADIIESGSNSAGNPKRMAIISNLGDKYDWTKYSGTFRFKRGTRFARVQSIDSNYSSKNYGWIWYCKLIVEPNIPSQEDIDKAQNEAIKANTLALENQKTINDKQKGIAAAHTKAIDSNRKAIRALAKIDLGGSLLAYMPLTDAEIEKGLTREYTPAWAANAANVLDGSKMSGTDSARGYVFLGSSGGTAQGEQVYAQVSPGTQYLFEIDVSSPVNTTINFRLACSNKKVDNTIKKTVLLEKDEYGGYKVSKDVTNARYVKISSSDVYQNGYRYLVEFKEGVEDVYVQYVNWTKSNSITVKSLSFAPYTPSQSAIDARQNKALEGLKLAQDLQRDMTKQQQDFTTKLYDMSAGVIHLLRDEVAGSITHEIGFVMPSTDRLFKIYARTSFRGNLTILVNYATGIGDGLKTHRIKDTNLVTMSNPRNISSSIIKKSIFEDMPYSYRFGEVKVDVGDVESIVVLIDHINWKQG